MRKLSVIAALLLVLYALIAIYIVPSFSDTHEIETKIAAGIKSATGKDALFLGPVSRKYFPLPRYSIPGIRIKNDEGLSSEFILETGEAAIHPSLISLFILSPKISSVTINNPVFEVDVMSSGVTNLGGLLLQNSVPVSAGFPSINLVDGKFMLKRPRGQSEITLLSARISPSVVLDKPVKIEGVIGSGANVANIELYFGKYDAGQGQMPVSGKFTVGGSSLGIDGNISHPSADPLFTGKTSVNIARLPKIIADYTGWETKLPEQLMAQNFTMSGLGEITLDRFSITNAETVFASGKGKGALELSFPDSGGPLLGIEMKMKNLDMDALGAGKESAGSGGKDAAKLPSAPPDAPVPPVPAPISAPEPPKAIDKNVKDTNVKDANGPLTETAFLPDNLEIILDLSADGISYHQQKINDIRLEASLAKERQAIKNLSFGLPENARVEISANPSPDQTGQGWQLNGHAKIYGDNLGVFIEYLNKLGISIPKIGLDNFFAESDFVYSPGKLYLATMDVLLADASFTAKALFNDADKRVEAIIQATNIDLDKIMPALAGGMKPEGQSDQNLTVFDNLRTLPYKVRLAFSADEIVYATDKYSKSGGDIQIDNGILSSNFEGQSFLNGKFKTTLKIDASNLKPSFAASIIADRLTLDNFISLENKADDVLYIGREKPAPFQAKFESDPAEAKVWPIGLLDFSAINFMNGSLQIDAKIFAIGKLELKDLSTALKMQDGVLSMDSFKSSLFGGTLDLKANIATRGRPGASISYALSNADLGAAGQLIAKTNAVSGHFGTSGSVSFSGFNINDWMNQATGSANIVMRDMEITGFNLKEVYDRLPSMKTPNAYESFMRHAFSEGGTKFDFLGGNLFLNDGIISTKGITLKGVYIGQSTFNAKINLGTANMQAQLSLSALTQDSKPIPITFDMRGTVDDLHGSWDYTAFKPYWEVKSAAPPPPN